jgi:vacuolar protein sorting-associated protein 54
MVSLRRIECLPKRSLLHVLAISTLLQPPIIRTGLLPHTTGPSASKLPSTRDIPPVTLTNIPRIDTAVFKPYLAQAGSLYEAFRRAKDGSDEGRPPSARRTSRGDQMSSEGWSYGMQRRVSGTPSVSRIDTSMLTAASPLEAPQPKRRTSGGVSRRAGLAVAPLSTIPQVYFEPDFHLENPRTFDIVSERSEIARPPSAANGSATAPGSTGKKPLAANAVLQEKLSWYMDTVEIHLISSISSASSSFFAALGSLRQLHSEAAESVAKIKALREDLAKLDQDMAVGGLKIVAMRKRRENMRKLGDAVEQLREVVESVTQCEKQVDRGEIEAALKGLSNVESLIAGDSAELLAGGLPHNGPCHRANFIDLRGIKALEGASTDIALLRKRIGRQFEARFIDTLLRDIRQHIDSVPSGKTFQRWDQASSRFRAGRVRTPTEFPAYMHIDSSLRSDLLAQLKGLARSDSIMPAAIAYREAILREFKSIIRRHIPSSNDDDAESTTSIATQESRHMSQQEKSSILARNLRGLDVESAEDMFKNIYSNVGEALRRLGIQVKLLLDITSSLGNPHPNPPLRSPIRSPRTLSINDYLSAEPSPGPPPSSIKQEEIQQTLDLSSLLGQAVDIAQAQITKILKVRTEQSTNLPLPNFLRYFTLNRLFADECEAVSGRGGTALKSVVNDHIRVFVGRVGDTERQNLVQSMDSDTWDARDFTDEANAMLSRILESSTKDVDRWIKSSLVWENESTVNGHSQSNGTATNGESKEKIRNAVIDEQKYTLPESALAALRGIEIFEHLLTGIPSMTQEISNLILEYLKLFNSRSSQLILGAGATRSAGLKNITTKHLALSSQALSFAIALIPHVREFVRRHAANPGNLIAEFDKVKRLFQEHQSGIHDKLVDIMSGRASAHVSAMKKIDWDQPTANDAISGYMETLIKETTTLHKVLSRHLPEMTVQMIMVPILDSYKDLWGRAYRGVEVSTPAGKERYAVIRWELPVLMC